MGGHKKNKKASENLAGINRIFNFVMAVDRSIIPKERLKYSKMEKQPGTERGSWSFYVYLIFLIFGIILYQAALYFRKQSVCHAKRPIQTSPCRDIGADIRDRHRPVGRIHPRRTLPLSSFGPAMPVRKQPVGRFRSGHGRFDPAGNLQPGSLEVLFLASAAVRVPLRPPCHPCGAARLHRRPHLQRVRLAQMVEESLPAPLILDRHTEFTSPAVHSPPPAKNCEAYSEC